MPSVPSASFDETESPDGDDPIPGAQTLATPTLATTTLATPAIHAQPRMLGQAAVLDRPEESAASPPPSIPA